jgi:hypothetical protein
VASAGGTLELGRDRDSACSLRLLGSSLEGAE